MRLLFALAALLLLATFAPVADVPRAAPPAVSLVWAEPLPLDASAPSRVRLGPLRYLGGWRLSSNDGRFGGLSAMHVERGAVLAFSDAGWMIRFPVPEGRSPVKARIAPLAEGPGSADSKEERDIEGMWAEGDDVWLSFERSNALWRFRRPGFHAVSSARPPAMRRWPSNRGGEALVGLRGGRFLLFSEGRGEGGPALLFDGDPARPGTPARALTYTPPRGYRATDAGRLPDGRILVLNRRFAWLEGVTAKLALLRRAGPGRLDAEEIADFRAPIATDNLEALSVTQEGGRTIVWIASDDNYNPLQRTLLMKFAWEG
ncbi:MAG: esterase-like activity of phytase family protein [Alphaproteobacteria bacterium]|nr:esterase-like activity of phytase family protein [Alphaproteobacteria bacterium]MBV9372519.1 esterase-like activity of phytase family protein [Alphaproteobacteria bacterium]MBV9902252.1 esterase-like activity of phytase family protein [Alphaproteobacteria bacterium]